MQQLCVLQYPTRALNCMYCVRRIKVPSEMLSHYVMDGSHGLERSHHICLWQTLLGGACISCPKEGFPSIRHDEVRVIGGTWMSKVCTDVCTEPTLQLITGKGLNGASAITENGARLDIAANGFWGGKFEWSFFDMRVFNLHAPSHWQQPLVST